MEANYGGGSIPCLLLPPLSASSRGGTGEGSSRRRGGMGEGSGRRRRGRRAADIGEACVVEAQGCSAAERGEKKEVGEKKEKEEGEWLTSAPHCHVASTSAKPATKIAGWPTVNGFDS